MVTVDVRTEGDVVVVHGVGVILGHLPLVVTVVGASVGGGTREALVGEGRRGCGVQDQNGENSPAQKCTMLL